jgi:hypothetical protein
MARAASDAIVGALVDALERDPTEIACALGIPSISAKALVPASNVAVVRPTGRA